MDARINSDDFSLADLFSLPWTREIVPDGGGYFARVQELDGCISEGATAVEALENLDDALRVWLEVAIEQGLEIPRPRVELEEYSGRFSVRVPKSLHRALVARAEQEGVSLNQLATTLLSGEMSASRKHSKEAVVARVSESISETDSHEDIAADAVRRSAQGVGALKGIATWLRNRGDINMAVVLYAIAGERSLVLEGGDPSVAASDFGAAGALANRHRRVRLAEQLWRESIGFDPTNIRSRSSLGQLLQRQGRFAEAIELLERVADIDNYAQLSLGWSLIYQGLADCGEEEVNRGLSHLTSAMRRWCAYANRSQLSPWLRQVVKLDALGSRFSTEVDHLLHFASSNANWGRVDRSSLGSHLASDAVADEADGSAAIDESSRAY
ncbi:toxin-antitoxin system HicB family antitoxin [Lentzea sp. NPDC003310]|uniref:toxin-antitoxin system HicB family antitoxin n=1 Tax=Lentzea sp. NPDC003310 TaxID=3154447 RepID=UPI0033A18049